MAIIDKPSDYFNTVLYTGNGYPTAGTQSITGVGFQPDFLWIKDRDASQNNNLSDVIRGASFRLKSNSAGEESELTDSVVSHDSDGFSVGTGTDVNQNTDKYVAWNWKAGGTASSNTDGSITSIVSANQTAGFSIVSYTASSNGTVGHGLETAPKFMIFKNRNLAGYNWIVYSSAFSSPQSEFLYLNTTNAKSTISNYWTSTAPTSTVFSVASTGSYYNTGNMIAYCFADVQGYSKFGSYTGNGSTDGTFVYTGFKPAWIMVKRTDSSEVWHILDNKRDTFNKNADWKYLDPASSGAEYNNNQHDFLSNGFKMRATGANSNASGGSFIYMAFAENPFVSSTGVPATAR